MIIYKGLLTKKMRQIIASHKDEAWNEDSCNNKNPNEFIMNELIRIFIIRYSMIKNY
ncbi:hypothetical protein GCM10008935_16430 [Alkalibacillus silvisoli]|uniref:Uncharacterized protein n=1 Tax=Alkalibacillus silvisoli TaxID=392823 RepID=A0ABP3JQS2_9BACI